MIPYFRFTWAIFKCVTWKPYFSCTHAWICSYVAPCWNRDMSMSSRENSTLTFWVDIFPLESWTTVSTWHKEIRLIPISSAGSLIGPQEHIHWFLPFFQFAETYRETGSCRVSGPHSSIPFCDMLLCDFLTPHKNLPYHHTESYCKMRRNRSLFLCNT